MKTSLTTFYLLFPEGDAVSALFLCVSSKADIYINTQLYIRTENL